MLQYSLEVGICWAILYLIYIVFLRRETFFSINRWYLLSSLVVGLLIPVLRMLPNVLQEEVVVVNEALYFISAGPELIAANLTAQQETESILNLNNLLLLTYCLGVLFVGSRFIIGLLKIKQLYTTGSRTNKGSFTLVETNKFHLPFSFLHCVFFSKEMPINDNIEKILKHELTHVQSWHTLDVLFLEVLQVLFWFNPLIILYKKSLKESHEYVADASVLQDTSQKIYGLILLRQSQSGLQIALANHFFHSHIKKRLTMMKQKKSKRSAMIKYLFALPVILLLMVLFQSQGHPLEIQGEPLSIQTLENQILKEFSSSLDIGAVTEIIQNHYDSENISIWEIEKVIEYLSTEYHINLSIDFNENKLTKTCVLRNGSEFEERMLNFKNRKKALPEILTEEFAGSVDSIPLTHEEKQGLLKKSIWNQIENGTGKFDVFIDEHKVSFRDVLRTKDRVNIYSVDRDKNNSIELVRFDSGKTKDLLSFSGGINDEPLKYPKKQFIFMDENDRYVYMKKLWEIIEHPSSNLLLFLYDEVVSKEKVQELKGDLWIRRFIDSEKGAERYGDKGKYGSIQFYYINSAPTQPPKSPYFKPLPISKDEIWNEINSNESISILIDGNLVSPEAARTQKEQIFIAEIDFDKQTRVLEEVKFVSTRDSLPTERLETVQYLSGHIIEDIDEEVDSDEIFKVVEQMPRFPGCENLNGTHSEKEECGKKKMLEFIYTNLKYPDVARVNGVEGTNIVQFVVEEDGSLSDMKLVRTIGANTREETMKVMTKMQEDFIWKPGYQKGKAVKVLYTLPIRFMLSDEVVGKTVEPMEYILYQNVPNPVETYTEVSFVLPNSGKATIRIFDVTGKVVSKVEDQFNSGLNKIRFTRSELGEASGPLYYQLESGTFEQTKKMILI